MSKIPVGLQLYTLREETAKDFVGTLKKVAKIGYQAVEFAGYGGLSAKELKKWLDDLGLVAPSSHVAMDTLRNNIDQQIEFSLETGQKYVMCPWLATEQFVNNFDQVVAEFRDISAKLRKHGLIFGYHNHAFEFEKVDGQYLLDKLYEELPGDELVAELDLYWVVKGGEDPITYLKRYENRVPIIHVKDMTKDDRQVFAEVGQGSIDYPSILDVARQTGVKYYIVEQDQCERPPLESVQMSFDYLKSIGIA